MSEAAEIKPFWESPGKTEAETALTSRKEDKMKNGFQVTKLKSNKK